MPRKETEIQPGSTFFLPAAQEKNLTTLLGVLGKKEATKAIEAIGKTDTNSWTKIDNVVGNLNSIVEAGGISPMITSFKEAVQLQLNAFVTPLTNQINTLVATALDPLKVQLTDIFNDLSTFVADNPEGGAIGAIIGGIAGLFLPGGEIWGVIGAMLGAGGQSLVEWLQDEVVKGALDPLLVWQHDWEFSDKPPLWYINHYETTISAVDVTKSDERKKIQEELDRVAMLLELDRVAKEIERAQFAAMAARIAEANITDPVTLRILLGGKLADLEEDF